MLREEHYLRILEQKNITVDYISKGDIVNCKYLKIRSKKYKYFYYCSILKKETQSNDCKDSVKLFGEDKKRKTNVIINLNKNKTLEVFL